MEYKIIKNMKKMSAKKLEDVLLSIPALRITQMATPALAWEEAILVFQVARPDRARNDFSSLEDLFEYMERTTYYEEGFPSSGVYYSEKGLQYETISRRTIDLLPLPKGRWWVFFDFGDEGSNIFASQVAAWVACKLGPRRWLYYRHK